MESWEPTTAQELQAILAEQVPGCDSVQFELRERCKIVPRLAPILRYGVRESVFVVAECGREGIYWEDVEEGFNASPLVRNGEVLEHWCNQDELCWALNRWLQPGRAAQQVAPAEPLPE